MTSFSPSEDAFLGRPPSHPALGDDAYGAFPWANPLTPSDAAEHSPFTVSIVRADGGHARDIPVAMGPLLLDEDAEIIAPADTSALSRARLRIAALPEGLFIEDLGSDGLFKRVIGQEALILPCELRFGSHRCLLEELEPFDEKPMEGFWGAPRGTARARLTDLLDGGIVGDTFILKENAPNQVGRERGDIVFHPTDSFISSNHARFDVEGSQIILCDLNSSNGTFVRVKGLHPAVHGAQFLMGYYLIKFSTSHEMLDK